MSTSKGSVWQQMAVVELDEVNWLAYVRFDPTNPRVANTIELGHGVNLDLDANGKLIGIEFLEAKGLFLSLDKEK